MGGAAGGVVQQVPVQLALKRPLVPLAQLRAHEQQLLAGVTQHIGVEPPDARQLPPVVAGHLAPQAALHMHHLVVGQGQHIVLREGVDHGEGHIPVVELAEIGVHLQIVAQVVHPSHVPLQVKAQSPLLRRVGHQRPRRGLLRHHQGGAVDGKRRAVQRPQKLDSLQILPAAVPVGPPCAALPVVVQIQHGRHRVHPQAVDVVLPQPVGRGGQQEAAHLRLAEVEHPGTPAGVLPLQRVAVLVQAGAVKLDEAVAVLAEVGGHPVQDHTHPCLMQGVHQRHEIVGRTVAAGGGEVAGTLIAPAVVQRVLRHRQQLHKVVAHALDIGGQLLGQLPVAEAGAVLVASPRAQMHLVDQQRPVHRRLGGALLPPRPVMPAVAGQVIDLAVGTGAGLGVEGEGIRLPYRAAVRTGDDVLIAVVYGGGVHRQRPHAVLVAVHIRALPVVEVTGQRHTPGVGRPDAERIALRGGMRAQICIRAVPAPAAVQLHLLGHALSPLQHHTTSAAPMAAKQGGRHLYLCLYCILFVFLRQ